MVLTSLTGRNLSAILAPPRMPRDMMPALTFASPLTANTDGQGRGGGNVTFTRATAATVLDSAGLVSDVASGVARFETNGLKVEGARTNNFVRSEEFSNASWSKLGSAPPDAPTVTANSTDVTAPDGTNNADKILVPATTASQYCIVYQGPVRTAVPWTDSVWLRTLTGTATLYLQSTPDGATFATKECAITTTWTRFELNYTPTATNWYFSIGCDSRDPAVADTVESTIYAWGAQSEVGAFASSYIPTTTATVTRNLERVTFPAASCLPATAPGTVVFRADTANIATAQTLLDTRATNLQQGVVCSVAADADPEADMFTTSSQAPVSPTTDDFVADTLKRVAWAFNTNDCEIYTGSPLTSRATDTTGTIPTGHTALALGSNGNSLIPMFGHVQDVMVFQERLTAFDLARI